MIVSPEAMNFSNKHFVGIIYGSPGLGKTTLALSAPRPLLIDFDGGLSRVKAAHRKAAIFPSSYQEVLDDLNSDVLKDDKFETIVIDTGGSFISCLQEWAKAQNPAYRQKNGALSQKGFGAVKQEAQRLSNYIKDVLHKNLIYVFHSVEQADKDGNPIQRLQCEGSFKNICWNWCDFGGYLQMIGNRRTITFSPDQEFFAKGTKGIEGTHEVPFLTPEVKNDFMSKLFDNAKTMIDEESQQFNAMQEQYTSVMSQFYGIIEKVVDCESANAAVPKIAALDHVLTSRRECGSLWLEVIKTLGLEYNAEQKLYFKRT